MTDKTMPLVEEAWRLVERVQLDLRMGEDFLSVSNYLQHKEK